jgi:ankyrin repeat protein
VTTETLKQAMIQSMKTEFAPVLKNAEAQRTQRLAEKGINNLLCVSPRPRRLCVKLPLAALLLCVLALIPSTSPAATNNLTALLQQGLFEEQANRNLDAAIADYQTLARQFDKDRQLAATAVFRLGECYRMQGKTNEAALEYQRILRDFSDQIPLATLSQQNLTGMGMTPLPAASAARQQQKDLLAKQIALAEQDLAETQKLVQVGEAPLADSRVAEREVLRLRQQLAALDAGKVELLDLAVPAVSEEDKEIARIKQMIQNSPDLINAQSEGGTPLTQAAGKGWLKVATFLIEHGADVNGSGGAPINVAAEKGNRAMVELLLSRGADVNARWNNGKTPLYTATQNKFSAVIDVLLANKADVNAQANSGDTPLAAAMFDPQIKTTQSLLAVGADPNLENKDGRTPFSFAAERGSPEIVKMFLAAKADPNGGKLDAPLLGTIYAKGAASAELLLQAGANPNAVGGIDLPVRPNSADLMNHSGHLTPLWLATYMKQLPMVQLLLKFKADPNDSQTDGKPLLFSALSDTNILKALLDAGAKIESHDATSTINGDRPNWTPLAAAAWQLNAAAVEILLKHGANPNDRDETGNVALHWAVSFLWVKLSDHNLGITELLLAHGADPNVRNNGGFTPLDWVRGKLGQNANAGDTAFAEKIAGLLRQHGALDVLPDWDRITVSRPSANFSQAVFDKGTNDWNQVSLFDVLGVQYNLVASPLNNAARYAASPYSKSSFATHNSLSFPDFSSVIIHHPTADAKKWETRKINLVHALDSDDCNADVLLQWGDVVEIPEADHVINQQWTGLTTNQLLTLKNCLTRHLQITVNGRTTNFVVSPQVTIRRYWSDGQDIREISDGEIIPTYRGETNQTIRIEAKLLTGEPFMLWPVLDESKTLLASSDLSRVKIKRTDAAGKIHEWTMDCSDSKSPPNFWLRDGDVVEVPAKP